MGTSIEAVKVVRMGQFQRRVNQFVQKAAINVMSELATTPNHAERVAFANRVFVSDYDLEQYTGAVLTNPTILSGLVVMPAGNGVSDSDLEFTVNSMYNAFAGIAT